jgi:hypothetical protein
MKALHGRLRLVLALFALSATASGCAAQDVAELAGDATHGRNNGTPGSALARDYIIGKLRPIADGLNTSASGDAAYLQTFSGGTNVLAVIPGTDLADEYVVVGAHYDHLGDSCAGTCTNDTIYNGATDNATGVAAALTIARSIAAQPTPPRRSVVLAFWDREEDGLLGSRYYVQNPLVPLADTVGYVNFDIQGANLLPSLRRSSFAIASETGGPRFQQIVRTAIAAQSLDTVLFSSIFGQNRSDYASFLGVRVPSVFFSDANGPCYHTVDDELGIVDFPKLHQQIATALRVTRELASTDDPPAFVSGTPIATWDDLLTFSGLVEKALADKARFSAADQATLEKADTDAKRMIGEGEAAFGSDDVQLLLVDAAGVVTLLTHGACDGFLSSPQATARSAGR